MNMCFMRSFVVAGAAGELIPQQKIQIGSKETTRDELSQKNHLRLPERSIYPSVQNLIKRAIIYLMAKTRRVSKVKLRVSPRKSSTPRSSACGRRGSDELPASNKKVAGKVSAPGPSPSKTRDKNADDANAGVGTCFDKLEGCIKKLVQCTTCKREWSHPTGLPCGHVFCGECLKNNQPSTSRAATRASSSSMSATATAITCEVCHFKVGRRAVLVPRTDLETLLPLIKRLLKPSQAADKQMKDEQTTVNSSKTSQARQIVPSLSTTENHVEAIDENVPSGPTPTGPPIITMPPPHDPPSQIDDIRLSTSQKELLLSDEKENIWEGTHAKHATPARVHFSIDDFAVAVHLSQDDEPDRVENVEDMETEVSELTEEDQVAPTATVKVTSPDKSMFVETEVVESTSVKRRAVPPTKVTVTECECNGKKATMTDSSVQTDYMPGPAPSHPAVNGEQPPEQSSKLPGNRVSANVHVDPGYGSFDRNKDKFSDQPLDLSMPTMPRAVQTVQKSTLCALTFVAPLDLSSKRSGIRFDSRDAGRKRILNPVVHTMITEPPGFVDGRSLAGVVPAAAHDPCLEKLTFPEETKSGASMTSSFRGTTSKIATPTLMSRKRALNEVEDGSENGKLQLRSLEADRNEKDRDVMLVEEFSNADSNREVSSKETKKVKTGLESPPLPSQASSATFFDPDNAVGVSQPEKENCVRFSTPQAKRCGLKRRSTIEDFTGNDDHNTSLDSMDKQMLNFNTMAFLADDKPSPSPPQKVPDVVLEEVRWNVDDSEDEAEPDFLPATPNQKSQSILVASAVADPEDKTPSQILKDMNEEYEKDKKIKLSSVFPNPNDFEMDEPVPPSIVSASGKAKAKIPEAQEVGTSKHEVSEKELDTTVDGEMVATCSKPLVFCPTRLNAVQEFDLRTLCNKTGAVFQRSYSPEVTHLIVDLVNGRVPHTMKYLSAIAQKKWILTFDWVKECLKQDSLVNEEPWETSCFPNCDRGPRKSRLSSGKLFRDVTFFVGHKFSHSGISAAECKKLLVLFGGKVVEDPAKATESILLIADPYDRSFDYNVWYKRKGWLTVTWEWVTDCILSYSVLAFTETGVLTSNLDVSRIRLPLGISDELCTQIEH